MAANENNSIWEILKTFDYEELILAFCLSMLIGLLIGILIFILLTWISRHRASVRISTRPNQSSGAAGLHNLHGQLGSYRNNSFNLNSESTSRAVLNLQRQTSVDPNEVLGRSPSFQASTFRPVRKKGSDEKEDENQRALRHDTTGTDSVTDPYNMGQSESFWLGKGSLRGFLPTQTPPPAYDSVIHIFQETHT
ncbi:myc target protein 1 homolog [Neoarius graeffei]|uniref:myc target protein 1 homolog n=1 Tax=Neoarius graeffei TaxID=443677 RepID=UPI00298C0B6F|nr:myc target protein 1 homolog [Neoarius graeffei]